MPPHVCSGEALFRGRRGSKDRKQSQAGAHANGKHAKGRVGLSAAFKGGQSPVPDVVHWRGGYFPALFQQGPSSRLEAAARALTGVHGIWREDGGSVASRGSSHKHAEEPSPAAVRWLCGAAEARPRALEEDEPPG